MLPYVLTVLSGLLALVSAAFCLSMERNLRRDRNRRIIHTAFTMYGRRNKDGQEVQADLYCTDNLIGRRKRKCNICLADLKDSSISRVHARLWIDNGTFCIAPVARYSFPAKVTYSEVYLNGTPVPREGMIVYIGDVIRMGNSEFYLKDTKE